MPESGGFLAKRMDENIAREIVTVDGQEMVKSHVLTFVFIPAETGVKEVGGGSVIVSVRDGSDFFSMLRQRRIIFETSPVKVKPLPEKGRPADFSGNVGSFTMEVKGLEGEVNVYDEKKLTVSVKGKGNLFALKKPVLVTKDASVRVISGEGQSSTVLENGALTGTVEYGFTLIPEKDGVHNLGKFRFDYYDTVKASYTVLESEMITVTANGRGKTDSSGRMDFDREKSNLPEMNLLVIGLILLFVTGAVMLVVLWERKRYSIATNGTEKQAEPEKEKQADLFAIKKNVERARFNGDGDAFFRAVDELGRHVNEDDHAGRAAVSEVKEKLYALRFGGGTISADDMAQCALKMKEAGVL